MRITGRHYYNGPDHSINDQHASELSEIITAIYAVNAADYRIQLSKEKTMEGRVLYSSTALHKAFRSAFAVLGWKNIRVQPDDSVQYYIGGYLPPATKRRAIRDMDFVKNRLVVQVQFGRYFFMLENIAAKLAVFKNLGIIDAGVEIMPVQKFATEMTSGMSYFEQLMSDLENGGRSYIDIPILIVGIAP